MIVPGVLSVLLHASVATSGVVVAATTAVTPGTASPATVLGVDVSDVPPAYPRRGVSGAYVTRIVPNSPAEIARILPGDVIVQIHGAAVTDHGTFRTVAGSLAAGSSVDVAVRRYGRSLTLSVAPVPAGTLYAKAPSCEPDSTVAELGAAAVSARRRDFDNEREHAARALDLAETCASIEQRLEGQTLLSVADAFAAMGTAAAGQTDREGANNFFGNAWLTYRYVATTSGMTSDERQAATAKAASLAKRFPSVTSENDPAIVDGLAYAGESLGPNPFTVVDLWTVSGDAYTRLLHLRVKIDTARDALLFANFFRVSVPTDDGPEVFFAIDSAGRPGPRINYPGRGVKAEISPDEDLGLLGHVFVVAQTPATYVLTFVIGDNHADLTNVASTLAYLPQ